MADTPQWVKDAAEALYEASVEEGTRKLPSWIGTDRTEQIILSHAPAQDGTTEATCPKCKTLIMGIPAPALSPETKELLAKSEMTVSASLVHFYNPTSFHPPEYERMLESTLKALRAALAAFPEEER